MESIRPEAARIKELINNYIVSVPSYILVITGQPGCGKTFTVNNVFEHFQQSLLASSRRCFFKILNCIQVGDSAVSSLLKQTEPGKMVLALDEADQLDRRELGKILNQSVKKQIMLILIGNCTDFIK